MARLKTLFTGSWADVPLEDLAAKATSWGYEGLELACTPEHFDVDRALSESDYCPRVLELLARYGLECRAISNHLAGHLVLGPIDERSHPWIPAEYHNDHEATRQWAIEQMQKTAQAAHKLGAEIVVGFVGSPIWHLFYAYPSVSDSAIEDGFQLFAERWHPILDVFRDSQVKFALEVAPTQIAFDVHTAAMALQAVERRAEFGFNFDPSHLFWQAIEPTQFLRAFQDRIFHVHVKDAALQLDGRASVLCSHLPRGDFRRGWEFRSPGHGSIDFEAIVRTLTEIGYTGPLSVDWDDPQMDRDYGADDAAQYLVRLDFPSRPRTSDH